MRADAFGDLVNLGDEERARSGNPELDRALVGWIEGSDRHQLTVDERALQSFGAPRCALAVWAEVCAS
jgi:hypothetical protein